MKFNTSVRRLMLVAGSLILMIAFQNCGQPGSIAQNPMESLTSTPEVPSPPEDPVTPTMEYVSLSKDVSVVSHDAKVDVLVVIDNSGSMEYEQASMADRFDSFLDKLQGIDWQVGIVTTAIGDSKQNDKDLFAGNLIKFSALNKYVISSNDGMNAAREAFAKAIKRSERGSGQEQGIHASYLALQKSLVAGSRNSSLVRPGAALSIIVVTDSDETVAKDKDGVESSFPAHGRNFAKNLVSMVTKNFPGKSFKFHSIIVKPGDAECRKDKTKVLVSGNWIENLNESYGVQYVKASKATGGIVGSVCEADYSNQLKSIGESTADQIKAITLDCAPVDADKDGTVDVVVRNVMTNAVISDYKVNGMQVEFAQALSPANYRVVYTCAKTAN